MVFLTFSVEYIFKRGWAWLQQGLIGFTYKSAIHHMHFNCADSRGFLVFSRCTLQNHTWNLFP